MSPRRDGRGLEHGTGELDRGAGEPGRIAALSRKLVRASASVLMADVPFWVTDLRMCHDLFALAFPERAEAIGILLASCDPFAPPRAGFDGLLDSFGPWLADEFDERIASRITSSPTSGTEGNDGSDGSNGSVGSDGSDGGG